MVFINVYERIKLICSKKNINISSIERGCNLSNGSISKWKTQIPKADNLYIVAKYLGTTVEYFLTGENSSVDKDNSTIIETETDKILTNIDPKYKRIISLWDKLDPIEQARFQGEISGYLRAKEK